MQPPSQGVAGSLNRVHCKQKSYWLCMLGCAIAVVLLCGSPSKLQRGPWRAAGQLNAGNNVTHLAVIAMMESSDRQVRGMLNQDIMLTFPGQQ